MKKSEKTLKQISQNPESMTEKEIRDFNDLISVIKDFARQIEPYNIKIETNNTTENLSEKFYQEHFLMSSILDAFQFRNEITFKELNEFIANYIPKEFIWDMTVHSQNLIIAKMIRMKLIDVIETDNKYIPSFRITENGFNAYQNQTFQTLASTSFFNFQTFRLSKRANMMNILMLIVTIMSVVVTIITIFK